MWVVTATVVVASSMSSNRSVSEEQKEMRDQNPTCVGWRTGCSVIGQVAPDTSLG